MGDERKAKGKRQKDKALSSAAPLSAIGFPSLNRGMGDEAKRLTAKS
jgi:hypothetical protein